MGFTRTDAGPWRCSVAFGLNLLVASEPARFCLVFAVPDCEVIWSEKKRESEDTICGNDHPEHTREGQREPFFLLFFFGIVHKGVACTCRVIRHVTSQSNPTLKIPRQIPTISRAGCRPTAATAANAVAGSGGRAGRGAPRRRVPKARQARRQELREQPAAPKSTAQDAAP